MPKKTQKLQKETVQTDSLSTVVANLVSLSLNERATEYIAANYPGLRWDSITDLLRSILIEIVKGGIKHA